LQQQKRYSVVLLTFVEVLELLRERSHILLELDALLLFVVVLSKCFQVDLRNFFVFAVKFIEL